jgi:hypothetical protein
MAEKQFGDTDNYEASYFSGGKEIPNTSQICHKMFSKVQSNTRLGPNCKVMLTVNIDVRIGLTNKAVGIIRKVLKSNIKGDKPIMLVEFEN